MSRILFFSGNITRAGGTERVAITLANALSELPDTEVAIVSLTEGDVPFFPLRKEIKRYSLGKKWHDAKICYLVYPFRLKKILSVVSPDIVVDIDIVLDVISSMACDRKRTKIISWEHFNRQFEETVWYRRWILRTFTAHTDACVTLTEKDRDQMRQLLPGHKEILCIPNALDSKWELNPGDELVAGEKLSSKEDLHPGGKLHPGEELNSKEDLHPGRKLHPGEKLNSKEDLHPGRKLHPREELKSWRESPASVTDGNQNGDCDPVGSGHSIVTVGALIHRKGMDLLAKVATEVLHRYPDWKWYLLGEGPMKEELEQVIEREHLEGKLILVGQTREVARFLQQAEIFVMTSRAEGLPMSLLEAAAAGLPQVAFDIPTGPAEVIRHGETGYLVPPFEWKQMVQYLSDLMEAEELRRQMGQQALERSKDYELKHILALWKEVFDRCQRNGQ